MKRKAYLKCGARRVKLIAIKIVFIYINRPSLKYNSVKNYYFGRTFYMFIYSFRAATLKFFGIIAVTLAALIAIIAFVPVYAGGGGTAQDTPANTTDKFSYDKIKTSADAANFLAQFGWTVDGAGVKSANVTIPAEFDKVFASYNEIQRAQGLDLSKYKKKELTRYTFELTNYKDYEGKVYANVLVYRNKVVGGDICSADVTGFVHGFEGEKK